MKLMRSFLIISILITAGSVFCSAKERIAVFDPETSGIDTNDGTRIAIREIISSTIVNNSDYEIVERSLLEKVMEEQQFSNSGVVDDKDATQIGKLAGADKIILSVITETGGKNMLSIKILDVTTASVEKQQVKILNSNEVLNNVEPMTLQMLSGKTADTSASSSTNNTKSNSSVNTPIPQNADAADDEIVIQLLPYNGDQEIQFFDAVYDVKIDGEKIGNLKVETGGIVRVKKNILKNKKDGIHKLTVQQPGRGIFGGIPKAERKFNINNDNYFKVETTLKWIGKITDKGKGYLGQTANAEKGERDWFLIVPIFVDE